MLVRFLDVKQKVHWVNPIHVKVVTEDKKGVTLIAIKHELGWGSVQPVIKTRQPVDEVAELLNVGMPDYVSFAPSDDGDGDDDGGSAAMAAAMSG
ncbi:MAG: hypothetical protein RIB58_04405 [Phycisphaerales bacterium]